MEEQGTGERIPFGAEAGGEERKLGEIQNFDAGGFRKS